jgi:hypothetical protein
MKEKGAKVTFCDFPSYSIHDAQVLHALQRNGDWIRKDQHGLGYWEMNLSCEHGEKTALPDETALILLGAGLHIVGREEADQVPDQDYLNYWFIKDPRIVALLREAGYRCVFQYEDDIAPVYETNLRMHARKNSKPVIACHRAIGTHPEAWAMLIFRDEEETSHDHQI